MSSFENLDSAISFDQINNKKINENKDYLILFIYMQGCGACNLTKPVINDILKNNSVANNCKIIKVHGPEIKDTKLKALCNLGYPAIKVLKKNGIEYKHHNIISNEHEYTTDGFLPENYIKDKKVLSTSNTINEWFKYFKENPVNNLKSNEKYDKVNLDDIPSYNKINNKEIYVEENKDDGSGYTVMKLCNPLLIEQRKSFNKIINERIKLIMNKYKQ
jgi:hypothetical protein